MAEFNEKYNEYVEYFNDGLNRIFDKDLTGTPNLLKDAITYAVKDGGKRIRPVLCLAAADMLKVDKSEVINFAVAVELIHSYSLVHDDLPSMDNDDYRNGYKSKQLRTSYGSMNIEVPQDRKSTFSPKIVKKRQKDISAIDQKIISMYAKGMTTRQISETIQDIYGFEASEGFISDVTDKIMPQIEEWQNRPLDEIYPVIFIDAIHYSVRDDGIIRKLAAYVMLGINLEGRKEVLTIQVGQNESAKYWLSVLNELKNRGVKDILLLCADGLTGIKEAITAAFPETEYQRCIVHQVRNTLKYVADKDKKQFAADLKKIYHASNEQKGREALEAAAEKWQNYPNAMKSWFKNWDAIVPIFKFSTTVRTVIYTTNAIESLNSTYRKLNRQRSVFPSDTALLKALYLATFEATKKWTMPIRNWGKIYGELAIMYDGRLPE